MASESWLRIVPIGDAQKPRSDHCVFQIILYTVSGERLLKKDFIRNCKSRILIMTRHENIDAVARILLLET